MKKLYVDTGLVTVILHYSELDETATLHKVEFGMCEAVEYPLTDWDDIAKFNKLLEEKTGLEVVGGIAV